MRYAVICAGVMLAIVLLWPLAFARTATVSARPDLPATVSMPIPPAQPPVIRTRIAAPIAGGASCFARYEAAFKACSGTEAEACKLVTVDKWDVCESSGRWPD